MSVLAPSMISLQIRLLVLPKIKWFDKVTNTQMQVYKTVHILGRIEKSNMPAESWGVESEGEIIGKPRMCRVKKKLRLLRTAIVVRGQ